MLAASGQLRNMATVGGNLLQRTRCGYFTDITRPCNKREPGSGCPAIEGSITTTPSSARPTAWPSTRPTWASRSPPSTPSSPGRPPRARRGPAGRLLPAGRRHPAPRDPSCRPARFITHVTLPPARVAARSRYRKVRERASYAFAIGLVAAALEIDDGVICDARLALGAVALALAGPPRRTDPRRRARLRRVLRRRGRRRARGGPPLPHNGYKVTLLRSSWPC